MYMSFVGVILSYKYRLWYRSGPVVCLHRQKTMKLFLETLSGAFATEKVRGDLQEKCTTFHSCDKCISTSGTKAVAEPMGITGMMMRSLARVNNKK